MNKKNNFGTISFTLLTLFSFALFFCFIFIGLYNFMWFGDMVFDLVRKNTFYLVYLPPLLLSIFAILSFFFMIGYLVGIANKSRSTALIGSILLSLVFGLSGMIKGLESFLLEDFDLANPLYLCSIISSFTSLLFIIFSLACISISYKKKSYKANLILSIFSLVFALATFALNFFALDIFSSLNTFFTLNNLLEGNMYRFLYPLSLVIFSFALFFLPAKNKIEEANK
ncbi:MAG TPA: hypothetical protein DEF61_05850 [Firmicutes bacterium]|nr:hypothetical protein [Bacillota bacterium]HBM70788.1 hypothetical protein [Bacillota bacterium]HBX25741.1 hypothetical protein [Bacillota bacterium]